MEKENEDFLVNKIAEDKRKLEKLREQWVVAKTAQDEMKIEIFNLELKEIAMKELIKAKLERKKGCVSECEKLCAKISDLSCRRKIVSAEVECEENKRIYYKDLMANFTVGTSDFLDTDEYPKKLDSEKDHERLTNEIVALTKKITEKKNTLTQCHQECAIAENLQKQHLEKVKYLEKSLENIENTIQNQEKELKLLEKSVQSQKI